MVVATDLRHVAVVGPVCGQVEEKVLAGLPGAGAARNVGLENAKGEIIAFLDDDCRVPPEWLDKIIETFKKYPEAAAVGGALRNPDNTPLAWASYILEFSEWFPTGPTRKVRNIPTVIPERY